MASNPHKSETDDLRRQAEQWRRSNPTADGPDLPRPSELIEELQIHQIELKLQNDELRAVQEDLEESRNRYRDLYDFAPVSYFTVDLDMRVTEANLTFSYLLGSEQSQLVGRSFARVVYPDDQDVAYLHYRQVTQRASPRVDELRLRRFNGSVLTVSLSSSPLRNASGEIIGARSIMSDVTERKRMEDELYQERLGRMSAEQANKLKLQFLAMVSHELRTPLASIKGFASTLLADDVNWDFGQQREFIAIMDEEADRLMELIEQLLDVSRLQAGALKIKTERQSLVDVVFADAMPRLETVTADRQFIIDMPDDLPNVDVDRDRIAQVIINLVDNAAKYSQPGSQITLRARQADNDVRVEVVDQGTGIPPEEREHVFDIFSRLENSNRQGAGLGLAICKSLVEAHGGKIWIESAPEQGAVVAFTLPLIPPPKPQD